jgi:copper chaperone CopZ
MSCCSTNGSRSSTASEVSIAVGIATQYQVTGMTCSHCEQSIAQEVSAIEGVTAVRADAATGTVTVTATKEIDEAAPPRGRRRGGLRARRPRLTPPGPIHPHHPRREAA